LIAKVTKKRHLSARNPAPFGQKAPGYKHSLAVNFSKEAPCLIFRPTVSAVQVQVLLKCRIIGLLAGVIA
jgi:hypothetical protein